MNLDIRTVMREAGVEEKQRNSSAVFASCFIAEDHENANRRGNKISVDDLLQF